MFQFLDYFTLTVDSGFYFTKQHFNERNQLYSFTTFSSGANVYTSKHCKFKLLVLSCFAYKIGAVCICGSCDRIKFGNSIIERFYGIVISKFHKQASCITNYYDKKFLLGLGFEMEYYPRKSDSLGGIHSLKISAGIVRNVSPVLIAKVLNNFNIANDFRKLRVGESDDKSYATLVNIAVILFKAGPLNMGCSIRGVFPIKSPLFGVTLPFAPLIQISYS